MANLLPGLFPPDQSAGYFPPAPQNGGLLFSNPDSKFSPELFTRLGIGLMSGNTVADQLSNGALGAQSTLDAQKAKALSVAQQNKTVMMLQDKAPELAQAVAAGVMTPGDAYGAFVKKQQADAVAARPVFQQLPDGTYGFVHNDTESFNKIGTAAKPAEPKFTQLDNGDYGTVEDGKFTKLGTAAKPVTPTTNQQDLIAAGLQPGTPEFQKALLLMHQKSGLQVQTNPDGTVTVNQGPNIISGKLTEDQSKNSGFLLRAKDAQATINKVEDQGTSYVNQATNNIPIFGNALKTQDAQQYERAKLDFVTAVLRKESGAAISPAEYTHEEQKYFPQPSDGPKVIADKRKAREDAIAAFRISAGPAAEQVDQVGQQQGQTTPQAKSYKDYFNQ